MKHPEPPKAYRNEKFLHSAAARNIRVQCELTEPRERFSEKNIRHTVVMFGSARLVDEERAIKGLKEAIAAFEKEDTAETRKALQMAKIRERGAPYYEMAREVARKLAEWSKELPKEKQFQICTGGGPGIMEAGNRGAYEAGKDSIALGISLPFEQHINPYASEACSFEFHYFFVRKFWFFYLAKALLAFPGGFGTMDELFEVLTLIQTRKYHKHVPVILVGRKFWEDIINFDAFVEWGVISEKDLSLFHIVDSADEAVRILQEDFKKNFLKAPEQPISMHLLPDPDYPVEI